MLIGHVGKDPEVRYTGAGKAVASFTMATSDSWKDKTSGETMEKTDWHNIVAFEKAAEIIGEYVKKGKKMYIEGRIQNRSYDDKDGNKRYISEIIVDQFLFLDSAAGSASNSGEQRASSYAKPATSASKPAPTHEYDSPVVEDDLPF
jgi:single-strand DNA-binding protein